MKRILAFAAAIAVVTVLSTSSANAQCNGLGNSAGYGFGVGVNQSYLGDGFHPGLGLRGPAFLGGNFLSVRRVEEPPYFAKFPPVYYNAIVKRPYGISPYAAPAGIAPVEMSVPVPATVKNPYFDSNVSPVSDTTETSDSTDDKTTAVTIGNPYVGSLVAK